MPQVRSDRSEELVAARVLETALSGRAEFTDHGGDSQADLEIRFDDGRDPVIVEVTMAANGGHFSFLKGATKMAGVHSSNAPEVHLGLPPSYQIKKFRHAPAQQFEACVADITFVDSDATHAANVHIHPTVDRRSRTKVLVDAKLAKQDNQWKLRAGGDLFVLIHQSRWAALMEIATSSTLNWIPALPACVNRLWVGPALCSQRYRLWMFSRAEGWTESTYRVDFGGIDPHDRRLW